MARMSDLMDGHSDVSVSSSSTATLTGSLCAGSVEGFPVCGVQYAPHLVGEPAAAVDGNILDVYQEAYKWLHRRDLPLISNLGADTIRLRPWNVDVYGDNSHHSVQDRFDFFKTVNSSKVRKVIPTFQLSRHYADMLHGDQLQPESEKDTLFQTQFQRFSTSVVDIIPYAEFPAWSVDLSLDLSDLEDLTRQGTTTCDSNEPTWNRNYQRYKNLILFLLRWVQSDWHTSLQGVPMLLPLDISRLPKTATNKQLKFFLDCMSVWGGSGDGGLWEPAVFKPEDKNSNRWLWSFSLPMMQTSSNHIKPEQFEEFVKAEFQSSLQRLMASPVVTECAHKSCPQAAAVVMMGTSAVARDPNYSNLIIEDYGADDPDRKSALVHILQESFKQYGTLASSMTSTAESDGVKLDGFIVDEWQDNWDRGLSGPFALATDAMDTMLSPCERGSRFSHDTSQCLIPLHDSEMCSS